ncbi:unnamed protein product [Polarella glacialis]|uniref:Uncharacterized protein n=1 Tax=Polarella glacialis TaxID=89957 RepID=A0A813GUJ0_POLGL|nr:unnamed protein product [Polarella glacialis]
MSPSDRSLPFGRLVGLETTIAAKCQAKEPGSGASKATPRRRPQSAGPGRTTWRVSRAVPNQSFDSVARTTLIAKKTLGPNHLEYREKVAKVLESDLESRKKDSETDRATAGLLRRKVAEQRQRMPKMQRPPSRSRLFSEIPLIGTSESAVRWYLARGIPTADSRDEADTTRGLPS